MKRAFRERGVPTKLLISVAVGMVLTGAAAACEYKIVAHGSPLAASEAKMVATGVMHKRITGRWCEKFSPAEYELMLIANSYANEVEREYYAHVIVGMRKRDSALIPMRTFTSHVHLKRGGNRPDAVANAAQSVVEELLGALELIDVDGA